MLAGIILATAMLLIVSEAMCCAHQCMSIGLGQSLYRRDNKLSRCKEHVY